MQKFTCEMLSKLRSILSSKNYISFILFYISLSTLRYVIISVLPKYTQYTRLSDKH